MNPNQIKNPILRFLWRADRLLQKGVKYVSLTLIAAVVIVVLFQVFARYIFSFSFRWTEELSRLITVYAALLGGTLGARRGELACVTFLTDRFPPKMAKAADVLCAVLTVVFCAIAILGSISVLQMVIEYHQLTPAMRAPKWISYFSVTLSMSVLLIFTINAFVFKMAGIQEKDDDMLAGEGIL